MVVLFLLFIAYDELESERARKLMRYPDGDSQDSNFVVPYNVIDDDDLTVNEN